MSLCTGQEFLGQPLTGEHTVLYLALEDSEARIKNRIEKMQIAETNNLRIATRWWHNAEGVSKLKTCISAHSKTDLIAIDTKGVFGTDRTEESFQTAARRRYFPGVRQRNVACGDSVLYGGTSKNVSNLLNQMYRESIVDHGSKRGYWKLAGKSSDSFLSCAATEPYPDTEIMEA